MTIGYSYETTINHQMKSIKLIFSTLIITILFTSCNSKSTLQKYYVDNQENRNFIAIDIPTSALKLDESTLTDKQKKAYRSIGKLNFLGFSKNDTNTSIYESEKLKIKSILTDDSYKTLIKYGNNNQGAIVKYLGSDTAIDEVIIFGSDNSQGFGIVRVLGNDMDPSQFLDLVQAFENSDFDTEQLKGISKFFKK